MADLLTDALEIGLKLAREKLGEVEEEQQMYGYLECHVLAAMKNVATIEAALSALSASTPKADAASPMIDEGELDRMKRLGASSWKDVGSASAWVDKLRCGNQPITPPSAPAVAAEVPKPPSVYVEVRECGNCQHVGINDSTTDIAACTHCDWSGASPDEDHCPGCGETGTITTACPECGSRTTLLASTTVHSTPIPQPAAPEEPAAAQGEVPATPAGPDKLLLSLAYRFGRRVPSYGDRGEPVLFYPDQLRAFVDAASLAVAQPAALDEPTAAPTDEQVRRLKTLLFRARVERQVFADECDRLLAAAPHPAPTPAAMIKEENAIRDAELAEAFERGGQAVTLSPNMTPEERVRAWEYGALTHPERPAPTDEFERGRQQGMQQERALWKLSMEGQAIERMDSPADAGREALVAECKRLVRQMCVASRLAYPGDEAYDGPWTAMSSAIDRLAAPLQPAREPLSDERLRAVMKEVAEGIDALHIVMTHWPLIARAVEAAHGITAKPQAIDDAMRSAKGGSNG